MGLEEDYVGYKIGSGDKKCLTCDNFYGPSSCDVVEGNISPEAVCERHKIGVGKVGHGLPKESVGYKISKKKKLALKFKMLSL